VVSYQFSVPTPPGGKETDINIVTGNRVCFAKRGFKVNNLLLIVLSAAGQRAELAGYIPRRKGTTR
jgi:hypothetical protein